MKKRCTNSSCRKVFRVETRSCPYCGKQYPRQIPAFDKRDQFAVVLTDWETYAVIRAMRKHTGMSLLDAKTITDNIPGQVCTGIRRSQAEALKAEIRDAGGDAMIIPARRGTRGIFVLPKKAG